MTKSRVHTDERADDTKPARGRGVGAHSHGPLDRSALPAALSAALDAAVAKGARAPAILRVTEIAGYTDFVLLLSARNERQVEAITEAAVAAAKAHGATLRGVEGTGEHLWDLVDFDDFMIHVFFHPVRLHYDLESMWSDAPRVELGLPHDVMDTSDLDQLALPEVLPSYRGDATFGGFDDEFGEPEANPRWRAGAARRRTRDEAAAGDSLVGGDAGVADDDTLQADDAFDDAIGDDEVFEDDAFDEDDEAFDDDDDALDDDALDDDALDDDALDARALAEPAPAAPAAASKKPRARD
ncbi:MAG: ribosome silencing factor [Nannocystaceae bacterium]